MPLMPTFMCCCSAIAGGADDAVDTKQLISSLVSSLAWPSAVVVVAMLFRTQLKTLLTDRLRHIEAGPLKADFDALGSKVEATLGRAGIPVSSHIGDDDVAGRAKRTPQLDIAEAFGRVEQELHSALSAIGQPPPDGTDAAELAHLALATGLITPLTINAIEGVTVMRNLAIDGPHREITTPQVEEYRALVEAVLYAIRQNVKNYNAQQPHPAGT